MAIPQEEIGRRMDFHSPETAGRRGEHEEVMFWANAAVARQPSETAPVSPVV
jgi:hypothetical protein